jgi:hypothetical protein
VKLKHFPMIHVSMFTYFFSIVHVSYSLFFKSIRTSKLTIIEGVLRTKNKVKHVGILGLLNVHLTDPRQWSRSAGIISRLKNTVGCFFMREKYCSG